MVAIPKKVADALPDVDPDDRPTYDAMDEGYYLVKVVANDIEEPGPESKTGEDLLALTMEVVQPREHSGRKLWDRLSFSERAYWKVRSFFDAVDYDYDSDVDEIQEEEEEFVVYVVQEIQKKGKGKGNVRNSVNEYLPADDENMDLVPE